MTSESSEPLSADNAPFTAIFTGVSSISPLSIDIILSLITHLPRSQPLSIALLGPDHTYLESTITTISTNFPSHNNLTLLPLQCNISSAESLGLASHQIRATLGAWDLFIHHPSAHILDSEVHIPTTLRGSDADTWWNVFEINVHALHHISRHFFPKMKHGAKFINILPMTVLSSNTGTLGQQLYDRASAEHAAALAAAKVVEYLAAENKESGVVCVNAGIENDKLLTSPLNPEEVTQMALSGHVP